MHDFIEHNFAQQNINTTTSSDFHRSTLLREENCSCIFNKSLQLSPSLHQVAFCYFHHVHVTYYITVVQRIALQADFS